MDGDRFLRELSEVTDCDEEFLSKLQEYKLLGANDIAELNAKKERNGDQAQSERLYQILSSRYEPNTDKILIRALCETHQDGALDLFFANNATINIIPNIEPSTSTNQTTDQPVKVLTGKFKGLSVVKRTSISHTSLEEASSLLRKAKHDNVLQYTDIEEDNGQIVLLSDKCTASLHDWFDPEGRFRRPIVIANMDILEQVTRGLAHLHSHMILHTNLKPHSILISIVDGKAVVKLADYCFQNNIPHYNTDRPKNDDGWIAPEVLNAVYFTKSIKEAEAQSRNTWTYASDIYSLGCIFFYVLSEGKLPFRVTPTGELLQEKKLTLPEMSLRGKRRGLNHVIRLMTCLSPTERPPAAAVLSYHIFFSAEKKFEFLGLARKTLSNEAGPQNQALVKEINNYSGTIWGHEQEWTHNLSSKTKEFIQKVIRPRPRTDLVSELINAIVVVYEARESWSPELKQELGESIDSFLSYWEYPDRFPYLVHFVWLVLQKVKSETTLGLEKFYAPPSVDFKYVFTQMRLCGQIWYDPSKILGYGIGTRVFRGRFNDREVAVKRIDRKICPITNKIQETDILLKCDSHENVTKYFHKELQGDDVLFIALEYCDSNVHEWVKSKGKCIPNITKNPTTTRAILLQITRGLAHLHEKGIVHRDLTPANILLKVISRKTIRVKISDFGISRILPEGVAETTSRTDHGTNEYKAPEIFLMYASESRTWKMSTSADIFAAGCIFYFVVTDGRHPFCDGKNRNIHRTNVNIMDYKTYFDLDEVQYEFLGDIRLIQRMIAKDPKARPPAEAILRHHIFWSKPKCLDFLCSVTGIINLTQKQQNFHKITEPIKECIARADENYSKELYTGNWQDLLTNDVRTAVKHNYFRPYDANSILGLIPAIRNLKEHYDDQQDWVKRALGKPPLEYFNYWQKRFPFLIDNVWANFESIKNEPESSELATYFHSTYSFDYYSISEENLKIYQKFVLNRLSTSSLPLDS